MSFNTIMDFFALPEVVRRRWRLDCGAVWGVDKPGEKIFGAPYPAVEAIARMSPMAVEILLDSHELALHTMFTQEFWDDVRVFCFSREDLDEVLGFDRFWAGTYYVAFPHLDRPITVGVEAIGNGPHDGTTTFADVGQMCWFENPLLVALWVAVWGMSSGGNVRQYVPRGS